MWGLGGENQQIDLFSLFLDVSNTTIEHLKKALNVHSLSVSYILVQECRERGYLFYTLPLQLKENPHPEGHVLRKSSFPENSLLSRCLSPHTPSDPTSGHTHPQMPAPRGIFPECCFSSLLLPHCPHAWSHNSQIPPRSGPGGAGSFLVLSSWSRGAYFYDVVM